MIETFLQLISLFKSRKKLWLLPLILLIILVAGTLFLAQNSIIAPFIYTVF